MMTRKLAVAALAAAALAAQSAILYVAVASPLASALGSLEKGPAAAETTVTATAPAAPVAATRS